MPVAHRAAIVSASSRRTYGSTLEKNNFFPAVLRQQLPPHLPPRIFCVRALGGEAADRIKALTGGCDECDDVSRPYRQIRQYVEAGPLYG